MPSERSTPRTGVALIAAALVLAVTMGAAFLLSANRNQALSTNAVSSAASSLAARP
jgi:hypothetical protein